MRVLSASACLYASGECECVPMCVRRNCLCVVEYFVHVCTQTINMIKKTANEEENTIHEIGIHCTHSSIWGWCWRRRWWWWLNRLEWQKWRHHHELFFPRRILNVFRRCRPIFICAIISTHTLITCFFPLLVFSRLDSIRFVFGFTFLEFSVLFSVTHLLNSDPLCFLRIYFLHIKN